MSVSFAVSVSWLITLLVLKQEYLLASFAAVIVPKDNFSLCSVIPTPCLLFIATEQEKKIVFLVFVPC